MKIVMEPIGIVRSARKSAFDDHWDSVESWIELDGRLSGESLAGLSSFSHIEVLYYFHQVEVSKIVLGSEHPRENPLWPKVGIFAQRKRARPNLIGATIAKLIRIDGRNIYLSSFDAIDGTPILDIKPVFREYLPRGEIVQPEWATELMANYW